jgi:hypothetical protein
MPADAPPLSRQQLDEVDAALAGRARDRRHRHERTASLSEKAPVYGAFSHAPEWTRTITGY